MTNIVPISLWTAQRALSSERPSAAGPQRWCVEDVQGVYELPLMDLLFQGHEVVTILRGHHE